MTIEKKYPLRTGSRLPYCEHATIPEAKLRDYALSPESEVGRHKARVFASALGIYRKDWLYLHDQILEKLPESDATCVTLDTPWGPKWEVPILVEGRNARTFPVITSWLIPVYEWPHLTSARVDKSGGHARATGDAS